MLREKVAELHVLLHFFSSVVMALRTLIQRQHFNVLFYSLVISFVHSTAQTPCIENGRFYRDPGRPPQKIWSSNECSKYYLCLEGEVFDFKCSPGLLFDVQRQICDVKQNVDNCDVTLESNRTCPSNQLPCRDGTCIPHHFFCDGSLDCPDDSDEAFCDSAHDPLAATPCNQSTCALPNCFCSRAGTQIPGQLDVLDTPQMVILTFDGGVHSDNWDLFEMLDEWKNPNGCPIKATFFVNHQNNNYQMTQKLWNKGHEIAVNSITNRKPQEWWSHNATLEDFFDEMLGQANILNKFSGIKMRDIRGMRVPFFQVGWNRQFLMMKEFGFAYDSSIIAPFSNPPLWPYTLDHKSPHDCATLRQNCPTRPYPGVWEMVVNQLEADGYACAMVDSCPPHLSGDDIFRIFVHNFKRHYFSNRAPFGLYFRSSWFKKREYLEAFQDFVSEILQQPDVWFVTNWQAINWIKKPTAVPQLHSFKEWNCNFRFKKSELACSVPNVCKLNSKNFSQERYLYTCFQCPKQYPWVKNEFGLY